jgi:hypothetical protein
MLPNLLPSEKLKIYAATNMLKLAITTGGLTSGILYDYVRLELDEDAPAPE